MAASLALSSAGAAHAVDYTLLVPVDVRQLTPETKIAITCTLYLEAHPTKTQTQAVALVNGATSEAPQPAAQRAPAAPPTGAAKTAQLGSPVAASPSPMKFIFALSDDEAKAVFSYACAVDGGPALVKNGKALSNSVMQVGGCMSTKCTENARNQARNQAKTENVRNQPDSSGGGAGPGGQSSGPGGGN